MNITLTDRSRIETFEHCPRKRYWTYEHESRGLEKADSLKIDARYGTWVHNGIENGLKQGTECSPKAYSAVALLAGESFVDDCKSVVDWAGTTDQMRADITEGG